MQRLAAQLERETKELKKLQKLHEQVKGKPGAALRKRLLLKEPLEREYPQVKVIQQGQALGLDLLARYDRVPITGPSLRIAPIILIMVNTSNSNKW